MPGPARSLEISPDGRAVPVGLADGTIVVWDIASREEVLRLRGHTAAVNDVAFSHDGATALSGGADAQVIVWDLGAGREVPRFSGHSGVVRAVGFRPDGRTAVSGGFAGESMLAPGELILWDVATVGRCGASTGTWPALWRLSSPQTALQCWRAQGDAKLFSDTVPGATGQAQGPGLMAVGPHAALGRDDWPGALAF